jgi:hypothetical protein
MSDSNDCKSVQNATADSLTGMPADTYTDLPTFQRNVLRKYFRRANFTVEDVAEIDYQRLVRFPGVGAKGIQNIRTWLNSFGLELKNVPAPTGANSLHKADISVKSQRIARAIALLRRQGFIVRRSGTTNDHA